MQATPSIDAQSIHAVQQPIDQAKGMPNAAYVDPETFLFERENMMRNTWVGLVYAHELPRPRFAKPVEFMGLPLAVMRNGQDEIKVFHNVCSHRGMKLLNEEQEVQGMVRCPYHSWTYTLDGELKGTPHIGGMGIHTHDKFQCANHGLKEVRSVVWMGIVFINLSGDAAPFEEFVAPLADRWTQFVGKDGFDQVKVANDGSYLELNVKSNWKLAVENYCEAYHLPWVHPGLNSYSPLDKHYNLEINERMSGQGTLSYTLSDTAGTKLPQFPDWPADKIQHGEYVALYPNVLLGIQADHAFAIILKPESCGETLEKILVLYVGEEACGDKYHACRAAVLESWRVVFGEDVFAVEGMQAGRQSPGFQGGVFSPALDGPTHNFHQWVAGQYQP